MKGSSSPGLPVLVTVRVLLFLPLAAASCRARNPTQQICGCVQCPDPAVLTARWWFGGELCELSPRKLSPIAGLGVMLYVASKAPATGVLLLSGFSQTLGRPKKDQKALEGVSTEHTAVPAAASWSCADVRAQD